MNFDRPILISDNDGIKQTPGFSSDSSQPNGPDAAWHQCWSLPQQLGASGSYTYRIDDRGHQLPSRDLPLPAYQVIENGSSCQPRFNAGAWAPINPQAYVAPAPYTMPRIGANDSTFDRSIINRTGHEIFVVSKGLFEGFGQGAQDSLVDPLGTAFRLGTAVISAAALTRLGVMSPLLGKSCLLAGGIATVSDLCTNAKAQAKWHRLGSAIENAWRPDADLNQDAHEISDAFGRFTFDTALLAVTGAATGKALGQAERSTVATEASGHMQFKFDSDGISIFHRGADSAALTLEGKMLHSWSGAEIPMPISRATADGVTVTEIGKEAKIWQKPNEYIKIDHPNGRDEFYHANDLFVSENKSSAGGYTMRDFSFPTHGVDVWQLSDGRLQIYKDSQRTLMVDRDGKIVDCDLNSELWSKLPPGRRSLPKRPVVSDSHGVNVINFDNDVKLFVKPNGGTLVTGNNIREF